MSHLDDARLYVRGRGGAPHHLDTCGTAFRGCDPACPKEVAEQELKVEMAANVRREDVVQYLRDFAHGIDVAFDMGMPPAARVMANQDIAKLEAAAAVLEAGPAVRDGEPTPDRALETAKSLGLTERQAEILSRELRRVMVPALRATVELDAGGSVSASEAAMVTSGILEVVRLAQALMRCGA